MRGHVPEFWVLNETVIGSIAPRVFSRFVQQKLLEFLFDLCTGHCPCETLSGALFGSQAQAGDVLLSAMALLLLLLLVLLLLQTAFILSQLLLLLHGLELLLQLFNKQKRISVRREQCRRKVVQHTSAVYSTLSFAAID